MSCSVCRTFGDFILITDKFEKDFMYTRKITILVSSLLVFAMSSATYGQTICAKQDEFSNGQVLELCGDRIEISERAKAEIWKHSTCNKYAYKIEHVDLPGSNEAGIICQNDFRWRMIWALTPSLAREAQLAGIESKQLEQATRGNL